MAIQQVNALSKSVNKERCFTVAINVDDRPLHVVVLFVNVRLVEHMLTCRIQLFMRALARHRKFLFVSPQKRIITFIRIR